MYYEINMDCGYDFANYLYLKGLVPNEPFMPNTNLRNCDLPLYQETFIKYINDLFDAYPTEKITVKMLKSDYKGCNGIEICFPNSCDYVDSDVKKQYTDPDFTYSPFPKNFSITLRGDNPQKTIVFGYNPGVSGRHVNFKRYEKVNLYDPKIKKYIQDVLKILE